MPSTNSSKVVLITGCSSGFGLLIAAHLSERGHKVVATMRNLEKKSGLANEVLKRNAQVDIQRLDVTDKDSIQEVMTHISAEYGFIDCLVNNAGYGIAGSFEDLTEKEIRDQMEVNFFGVQNVTRAAIPLMRQRKDSRIINISSVAAFSSSPCFGAYNASKWALEGFSEALRYELKHFGIKVLLIEPGVYKTPIFYENRCYAQNAANPNSPYYEMSKHLKNRIEAYVEDCHKDPEEIAELVLHLMYARNPPFRNIPDIESKFQYFLRKFLPFRLYSAIVENVSFKGFKSDEDF